MGILNLTPDSFFDGGQYFDAAKALDHAYQMRDDGADIIDIGGESTRPGAVLVDELEEMKRVLPVVERLTDAGFSISVDTSSAAVMKAVLSLGVSLINDIRSFSSPGSIEAVMDSDCALCVMHMKGKPQNMQDNPTYSDVVSEVYSGLVEHINRLISSGIARERLILDPGFGFGKKIKHNFQILDRLDSAVPKGFPILVGLSRKSMLCELAIDNMLNMQFDLLLQNTNKTNLPRERLFTSVAAVLIACHNGADIVRVHDVKETKSVLKVWEAVRMSVFC